MARRFRGNECLGPDVDGILLFSTAATATIDYLFDIIEQTHRRELLSRLPTAREILSRPKIQGSYS